MPEAQRPLSAHLGQVFSAAEARADGVPARRLKSSDLIRVCRGLYLRRSAPELRAELEASHPAARAYQSHLERALAVGKYLPAGHFLSHASAAVVWGLPVPTNRLSRIEVACFRPLRRLRRTDVWADEASAQTTIVTEVQGVPVSGPASTWAMLAPTLSMRDGVALGDAVIRQHRIPGTSRVPARPLATITELDAAVAAGRRIGVARLRELLPQLSNQSASAPESHLRVLLQQWGLPPPQLDFDVRGDDGELLGCSELVYSERRLALEYEGGQHRTETAQWNRDIEKYRHYAQAGWEVIRVTAELLYRRPEVLRRQVEEAFARPGWSRE